MDAIVISKFILLSTILASASTIIGSNNTTPFGHFITHQASLDADKQQKQFAVLHAQLLKQQSYPKFKPNSKSKNNYQILELPKPLKLRNYDYDYDDNENATVFSTGKKKDEPRRLKHKSPQGSFDSRLTAALNVAAKQGLEAMVKLYEKTEPEMLRKGEFLDASHPGAQLSRFSEAVDGSENNAKAAYAALMATKHFQKTYKLQADDFGRQAPPPRVSFRRTPLEGLCPPRDQPRCLPAAQRYRTHDGTCNNMKRLRWGASLMPFNRFLSPEYGDGIDTVRGSLEGGPLPSARFVSLLVHGSRESEAPVTLMTAQWGQLIDHDLTSTAQPRSVNGSVPRCCGSDDFHPSCLPIKVPLDDPWLAPLKVRCLEFLRSAPAQRRDCVLSWREQTNQATSYLDASPVYSSNARTSDNARVFRNGLLQFGRGDPQEDVCSRGALSGSCIRPGDGRSGEQPGLLAMHHVWVGEHNRIALELNDLNPHWSDEKVYQEARRIVGALFQHITFREFLPLVVGREVSKLFELELLNSGYYEGYDPDVNPTVANSFGAAAFRFGHSLIQGTYMRCDKNHNFLDNNVALHNENINGDVESAGSLHRLLRGLAAQKAQMRDEFITAELTNHLFQSGTFPFGLDLAAINIQRGRDHGIPPYTSWREPCGLSPIRTWEDLEKIVGPASTKRIGHAYRSVHDIDLFVGGIAERPVIGGLVGPTFACIIAQQFSNLRKGDRFWYENSGFENSFTPAQLHSIRRVSLSQIMCRALGGGTLQPHIFLPHDMPDNERLPCGIDILGPIDLLPWLEEDPFKERRPPPPPPVQTIFSEDPATNSPITPIFDRIDFVPNGSTGLHKPTFVDLQPNKRDNTSMEVSDKLDLKLPTRFTSTIPPGRINKPHKVDTKKRKPTPTPFPHKKGHEFTTRRTVIINNIPVILRRSADPFSKETFDTNLETRTQDIELPIKDETTGRKGHDTIFVQINRYNTTKNETFNDKPERKLENQEHTIYGIHSGQKAFKRHPDADQYEIEINIRQTNNRRHPTNYYPNDYNSRFDDRNTVSTPFSYKPISTGPSSDQFDFRPITKPPKVIYLDDQDDYLTTTTPGLLQTFFMVGTNGIIDHLQRPVSFLQNNLFGGGSNSGSNSGITSGSSAPISSSNLGGSLNSPASSSAASSSSSSNSNIFNINIRPSGPTSGLSESSSLPPSSGSYGLHTASRPLSPLNYEKPSNPFSPGYPISGSSSFQDTPHHNYDRFQYLSTTTRRPYYRPTNSYFPRNKDASFLTVHDQTITSTTAETLPQPFNYRLTTFSSILPSTDNTSNTFDYDEENGDTDLASKFDKDGYLRPEHMLLKILSHKTNDSITTIGNPYNTTLMSRDDFVLPALLDTQTNLKVTKLNETSHFDAIPRRPATEILAEDYDELPVHKPSRHNSDQTPNLASFAQLNVLTKPERPDKWVIVDVPKEQSPLPQPPALDNGHTASIEYPKPIMVRIRSISNKNFGSRLRGPP